VKGDPITVMRGKVVVCADARRPLAQRHSVSSVMLACRLVILHRHRGSRRGSYSNGFSMLPFSPE
jgi:hypothetical protein